MKMRTLALTLLAATAAQLVWAAVRPAEAATITVTSTDEAVSTDGNCTLREAILAAENDAAEDACGTGFEADTIELASGATYTLTTTYLGSNGFPTINSTLVIEGHGSVIQRTGTTNFRFLEMGPGSDLTLRDLTLTGGEPPAFNPGGAIYVNGAATLTIEGSTLSSNRSGSGGGGRGGAIYAGTTPTLTFTDSVFADNTADEHAGMLYMVGGTLNVTGSTFSGNRSESDDGGALRLVSGTSATIRTSTFYDNESPTAGGAINCAGSSTHLDIGLSTFSGNRATGTGGGGALMINDCGATFTNTTITENEAAQNGGGLLIYGSPTASIDLINTILADNTAAVGGPDCSGTIPSALNSVLGDDSGCTITSETNVASGTALLSAYADAGTAGAGHHSPLTGSPAINAADDVFCFMEVTTDQLGRTRVGTCDIGSVEAVCGDGFTHAELSEQCDDGNTADGDGCSSLCQSETAGDDGDDGDGDDSGGDAEPSDEAAAVEAPAETSPETPAGTAGTSDGTETEASGEAPAVSSVTGGCSLIR